MLPVKFITLTNNGYIDYTLNCLKSLELIGFQNQLHCYSIDNKCHNKLQSKGYKSILINSTSPNDSEFAVFRQGNWHNITKRKFDIIYNELRSNTYVCITDGDIVFLNKDFMDFCLKHIEDNDLVIQNDNSSDDNHENLCSGFMFIKSSPKTIELFNPINVEKDVQSGWGDQKYINKIKDKLDYKLLPVKLFPNGKYYYGNHKKLKPMMIHFNYAKGHDKKKLMKKYKKWYI